MRTTVLCTLVTLLVGVPAHAQFSSGSTGRDGVLQPTASITINMSDHPDGIYHYTSVHIPRGVTVRFLPNTNNTPVVWLVQGDCVIEGTVDVSGEDAPSAAAEFRRGGRGGPGGFRGGNGGLSGTDGQGPGGGAGGSKYGLPAAFATLPLDAAENYYNDGAMRYGNRFLVPMIGGSGGGGSQQYGGGGGGGGALLIAASGRIEIKGTIDARGGRGYNSHYSIFGGDHFGGGGSGGAIRLAAPRVVGGGTLDASGGLGPESLFYHDFGGYGWIRIDAFENSLAGSMVGKFSEGFQPVLFPGDNPGRRLTIASIGGVPIAPSPTGRLSTPDALLSAQQNNPIAVVVRCANIPLNTPITVTVKPVNGPALSASGLNNSGTLASSTATILIDLPRGSGLIYATATTPN